MAARASSKNGLRRDYGDTEYREQYMGEQPTNGLHRAELIDVRPHDGGQSETTVEWMFEIIEGPFEGWTGRKYTNAEGAKWVEQNILVAIGVMKPGGKINKSWDAILNAAQPCRIRTTQEEYNDEMRASITGFLAGLGDDTPAPKRRPADAEDEDADDYDDGDPEDGDYADDEGEDGDEDQDPEPEEPPARSRRRSAPARRSSRRAAEPEDDADDEPEERPARRSSRRSSGTSRSSGRASTSRRGSRSRQQADDDDPPF